ncbi:sigma-70 family RNA polymerase sigma factor [Actinotalea sp. K2]|uniref:sigma-70 family RNA polymerase sigma factor n=1 Tax=Actinotalea sp. K2 TaxID=2939438 RepID=UPI00201755C4|nr:sigma-70 family RNA polymerase sigma factor [Actinotalea sp. K2]MCL3859751.1 sigma-70 family RNA polymerase sigma factor [Actinotalea sp. K2]
MRTSMGSTRDLLGDVELISAVRAGDSAAFGMLYQRHCTAARAVARRYTNSPADAEDAVADAFARVLASLRGGDGPDLAFRAYLFTVVRRVALHTVENGRRTRPADDISALETTQEPAGSSEDPAMADFERGVVTEAFHSLPARWQEALWYSEVERLGPAEIAPILGLTANGVAALTYRAREGLRQAYLQQHLMHPAGTGCVEINGKLGAYVRDGLGRRETVQVGSHLEDCPRCRTVALELDDVNHGMRTVIGPLVLGAVPLWVVEGVGFGGTAAAAASAGMMGSTGLGSTGFGAAGLGAGASGAGSTAAAGTGAVAACTCGTSGGLTTAGLAAAGSVAAGTVTAGSTAAGSVAAVTGAAGVMVAAALSVTTAWGGIAAVPATAADSSPPSSIISAEASTVGTTALVDGAPATTADPDAAVAPVTAPLDVTHDSFTTADALATAPTGDGDQPSVPAPDTSQPLEVPSTSDPTAIPPVEVESTTSVAPVAPSPSPPAVEPEVEPTSAPVAAETGSAAQTPVAPVPGDGPPGRPASRPLPAAAVPLNGGPSSTSAALPTDATPAEPGTPSTPAPPTAQPAGPVVNLQDRSGRPARDPRGPRLSSNRSTTTAEPQAPGRARAGAPAPHRDTPRPGGPPGSRDGSA